jgi:hypothetical protein
MQMMQMVDQKDQDLKKLTDFYKIKHPKNHLRE